MSTRSRVRSAIALAALAAACSAEHDVPPFAADAPLGSLGADQRSVLCDWLRARTALDADFVEATCAYEGLRGASAVHGCDERRALCRLTRADGPSPTCFTELSALSPGCADTQVNQHAACIDQLRTRVLPYRNVECSEGSPGSEPAAPVPAELPPAPACAELLASCPDALRAWGIE